MKYWAFHCNPKAWDSIKEISEHDDGTWLINKQDEKNIQISDKFALWVSGKDAGIYAFGEIIDTPKLLKEDEERASKYAVNKTKFGEVSLRVKLKYSDKFQTTPIFRNVILNSIWIDKDSLQHSFFNSPQGITSRELTKEIFEQLSNLRKNIDKIHGFREHLFESHKNKSTSEDYLKMVPKIEKWLIENEVCDNSFSFWDSERKIHDINKTLDTSQAWKELNKKESNWYSSPWNKWTEYNLGRKSIYNSLRRKMENVGFLFEKEQIPQRQNRKEKELKFVHPKLIEKIIENGLKINAIKFYLKPLSDDPDCEIGLVTGKTSPLLTEDDFPRPNSVDTYNNTPAWTNKSNDNALDGFLQAVSNYLNISQNNMKLSLNTILYGPPGTGKTHILKNQYMDMFTTSESSITRQDFLKDIIQNCSWWQVIALAVLELGKTKVADIFNHEYVQVKAQLSNSTTVTPTIWGQLQSHTVEDCEHVKVSRRMPPMIFNKTEKSEWEILQNEVEEQSPELLELKTKIENFESVPNKRIERYEFLTFHQSYSYEDFIEGIKPELSENDVSYKIEEGVFQKMCNRARNDSANNYAIFIDEINRGNISSIFGELITLIEDDKREGKPNEIKATLPYSKKQFSVPNNLYIIGTMNTADRSVEALDTALRRRFSFIEMNPEPAKLSSEEFKCSGINLEALLNAINARIEKLLDKDYCIGHSYFMTIKNRQSPTEEIKTIFQNKILPLLQEYFYGDWGKILLVIGKEFVETKKDSIKFLSTESFEDFEEYDEKPIYNFTNPSSWTLESFKSIYE